MVVVVVLLLLVVLVLVLVLVVVVVVVVVWQHICTTQGGIALQGSLSPHIMHFWRRRRPNTTSLHTIFWSLLISKFLKSSSGKHRRSSELKFSAWKWECLDWTSTLEGRGVYVHDKRSTCLKIITARYGGFHKWWYPKSWMVYRKNPNLKWMTWGYPHL